MNKQERIIAVLLGLCLAGWLYYSVTEQKKAADAQPKKQAKPKERFGDFDPEEAMRRAIERSFGKKTEEQ